MAVGVVKIHAAAAIQVVDFATSCAIKVRIVFDARALNPGESGIELRFSHEEGAVLVADVRVVSIASRDRASRILGPDGL